MRSRGMLGLVPRTRRGLVLFWTALFMLSIALQYAAAASPQSALAALNGAVYTSNNDGSVINQNIYDSKSDVYLTGGPCNGGSHLPAGDYYFQVVQPAGGGDLLSSDSITERKFTIVELPDGRGFISSTTGNHVIDDVNCTPPVTAITIQLAPFGTSSNGEYKLEVSPADQVEACGDFADDDFNFTKCPQIDQKSDNFKVGDNGNLTITKTIEGGTGSGSFPVSVDCGEDGTFSGTIVFPSPGFITIADIAEGASCTVTEGSLPPPPAGFTYGPPTYTNNPATIVQDSTVTIGVVNHLVANPVAPTLTIEKSNDAPGTTGLEAGDTVTYTLAYDLTGGSVDDGIITDVLPVGVTYVTDSATDSDEFLFDGYDDATRTLTWLADEVTKDGSVSYQATVDADAAEEEQPLTNTATIDSADTEEDSDESDIFVGVPPLAETSVPTPPQTDLGTTGSTASTGSMLLVLLALAGIVLAVAFVAPSPASIRRRLDR